MIKQKEKRMFYFLTNGERYLIETGFNDSYYCISKGKLYRYVFAFFKRKLGKIAYIKSEKELENEATHI